jgi:hypothetical protein
MRCETGNVKLETGNEYEAGKFGILDTRAGIEDAPGSE